MEKNTLIKNLQDKLPWEPFLDHMEREGFLKLTFIKAPKIPKGNKYYKLFRSGYVMLVGDPIQASVIRDTSHLHLRPYILFRPKVERQLRVIVKNSQKFKIPITFAGGKTGLSGSYGNFGIIVDMVDFQSYKEAMQYDFKNDIVRVNQNVMVSDLIKYTLLKSNNSLIFPVQPASALKLPVRVGGLIASNASGITSGKLGSVENWVERIRVMRPNGTIVEIDNNHALFMNIIGGNGYFGVILSATIKLYRPETNLKQAIMYGYNLNLAFKGLQSILDSKIFPLVSEFVISDESLPGKFSELGSESKKNKVVKWAALIEGSKNNVDKFIDVMKQQADCSWKILNEEEFQDYLQERSSFALIVQTEDKSTDYIAFPGFEDVLSEPKNLPDIIETINELFVKHGFHKVIFGYGHINFRKGQGLLLHMRLPVPIPYFYKENEKNLKLICETVFDVIINLQSKFNIKHKAEHSPGPFKIWLEPEFRKLLRKETKNSTVFSNPHLMIFDELLLRKFKVSLDGLQSIDEQLHMSEIKDLFVSAMILYLSGE